MAACSIVMLVVEMDYDNFKRKVGRTSEDLEYIDALHDVWSVKKNNLTTNEKAMTPSKAARIAEQSVNPASCPHGGLKAED